MNYEEENREERRSLIGTFILKNTIIEDCRLTGLMHYHFVDSYERLAFESICELQDRGDKINFQTVSKEAKAKNAQKRKSDLNKINIKHFDHYLERAIASPEKRDPTNFVFQMINQWKENSIISLMQKGISLVKEKEFDQEQIITSMIEELSKVLNDRIGDEDPFLDEAVFEIIDELYKEKESEFVRTGYKTLDKSFGGWQLGELTIVAAGTSVGKTSFMLQCAERQRELKNQCVFFALEMRKKQCVRKLLSAHLRIPFNSLVSSYYALSATEKRKVATKAAEYNESDLMIYDFFGIEFQELKNLISTHAKSGCKVFFIDQLMQIKIRKTERQERYLRISGELMNLAGKLNVSIIIAHQVNKESQKKAKATKGKEYAGHADMRDAAIENDASVVLMLNRRERYMNESEIGHLERDIMTVNADKNRFGKTGEMIFKFESKFGRLEDAE